MRSVIFDAKGVPTPAAPQPGGTKKMARGRQVPLATLKERLKEAQDKKKGFVKDAKAQTAIATKAETAATRLTVKANKLDETIEKIEGQIEASRET